MAVVRGVAGLIEALALYWIANLGETAASPAAQHPGRHDRRDRAADRDRGHRNTRGTPRSNGCAVDVGVGRRFQRQRDVRVDSVRGDVGEPLGIRYLPIQ